MNSLEASEFINDNQEGLRLLANKVKALDNIDTLDSNNLAVEVEARKIARDMIEDWIIELFAIKKGELSRFADEDDNIFSVVSKEESNLD